MKFGGAACVSMESTFAETYSPKNKWLIFELYDKARKS